MLCALGDGEERGVGIENEEAERSVVRPEVKPWARQFEGTARDHLRCYLDDVVTQSRYPRTQGHILSAMCLVLGQQPRSAPDHYAASRVLTVAIDLESHLGSHHHGEKLVAFGRAEQQGVPVNRVVEGRDVDLVYESVGKSPELLVPQHRPALVWCQLSDHLVGHDDAFLQMHCGSIRG